MKVGKSNFIDTYRSIKRRDRGLGSTGVCLEHVTTSILASAGDMIAVIHLRVNVNLAGHTVLKFLFVGVHGITKLPLFQMYVDNLGM